MKKVQSTKYKVQGQRLIFKIIFILFLSFTFNFSLLTFNLRKANAQSLALSISPPLLEVMIKPDKSITQLYKLVNTGESVVITPKLYELGPNGIQEDVDFTRDKWISIVSNDIDFDKPFLLGADKEADFLLKINPSASVSEQDYYRALVFTTSPNIPSDTTMSLFSQNLASPLLITITSTGVLNKAAQVTKFELPKIMDSFDPLIADIDIKNTGKTYFRPVGNLSLTGPVGRGSYDLIPSAILLGQTKKLITDYAPPQNLEIKTLYLPGFYIGKYQLELNFTLDESSTRMREVKTFYAIPWKAGLANLVMISIIVIIRKSRLKVGSKT